MHTVTIRPVEAADNARLADIIRTAFLEFEAPTKNTVFEDPTTDHLFELFQTGGALLWVAEEDGELLGCCGIYPTEGLPAGCAELVKFYLSGASRGKGVGKALFLKCLQSAAVLNYKEIYLESLPEFATAVGMYEKMGFRKLHHPLGHSGHTGCNIWMLKTL